MSPSPQPPAVGKPIRDAREDADCPHCRGGLQTYRYWKNLYRFDVSRARELVQDGRPAVVLDNDDVRHCLHKCRLYQQHLDHVDPQYPGILAHVWYPLPDGTVTQAHALIDGNHRAARCLRDGLPFSVQMLTEDESFEVTLDAPNIDAILASLKGRSPAKAEPAKSL